MFSTRVLLLTCTLAAANRLVASEASAVNDAISPKAATPALLSALLSPRAHSFQVQPRLPRAGAPARAGRILAADHVLDQEAAPIKLPVHLAGTQGEMGDIAETWQSVQHNERWVLAKQRTDEATLVRGGVEDAHKAAQEAEDAYQGAWQTAVETAEAWAASDELIQWRHVEQNLRAASAARSIAAAAATTAANIEAEHDVSLQAALQATEIAEDKDPSGWHIAQARVMKGWIEEADKARAALSAAREMSAVAAAEYDEAQYDALLQLKSTVESWTGVENLRQAEADGASPEPELLEEKVEEATLTDAAAEAAKEAAEAALVAVVEAAGETQKAAEDYAEASRIIEALLEEANEARISVEEARSEAAEAEAESEKTAAMAEELRRAAEATQISARGASGGLGASFQNAVGRRAAEAVMVAAAAEETAQVTRARHAKSQKVVDDLIGTMEVSALMYSIRTEGLTVNQVNTVRQKLPEGSRMVCAKNTLVKRAVDQGGDEVARKFTGGDDFLEYSNYWFFAPEDKMRETVDCWIDFMKEQDLSDNDIVGGIFDGSKLDKDGVIAITKLPTKQELMQQTAMLLKMLPTKLGRSIKQVPTKLGKAVKLSGADRLDRAVNALASKKD